MSDGVVCFRDENQRRQCMTDGAWIERFAMFLEPRVITNKRDADKLRGIPMRAAKVVDDMDWDRELLDYLGGQILWPALIEANAVPEGIPSTRWWLRPLPIRDPT